MKDEPSHMMKFMKQVTKEKKVQAKEEGAIDENVEKSYRKEITSKQNKQKSKQAKSVERKKRKLKSPEHLSVEEKNKKMKGRTPVIRERSSKKQIRL